MGRGGSSGRPHQAQVADLRRRELPEELQPLYPHQQPLQRELGPFGRRQVEHLKQLLHRGLAA